jgi:tetratricopeptide (TPR) repeat protein
MWSVLLIALLAQSSDFNAEGLKALDAGKNDAAVELFTKAISADPTDYSAHFNLALAYSLSSKDAAAIPEYKIVLELHPGVYEAELNLGLSLINTRDAVDAVPYLKQAVAQKPQEFRPNYYLAEALLGAQQFADAAAVFATALTLDPKSAPAELGAGQALAHQGSRKEAEPHYRKAATLDPSDHDFLLELASLYEDHRESQEAIALYREFPNNPAAQEHAGVLLLEVGQTADAISVLEKVVAKSPSPANRLALARAYVKNQQLTKAEPLAAQNASAAPTDYDLRMFYGTILRDQRKFPEAEREFSAASVAKPDSVDAWTELAGVLLLEEMLPQGLDALDHVRALGAETSGHLYLRAMTLDKLKKNKEAVEYYDKFLAADKNKNPDQEFHARQRIQILERDLGKR